MFLHLGRGLINMMHSGSFKGGMTRIKNPILLKSLEHSPKNLEKKVHILCTILSFLSPVLHFGVNYGMFRTNKFPENQTNKLCPYYTVHNSTYNTLCHKDQCSVYKKKQESKNIREKTI